MDMKELIILYFSKINSKSAFYFFDIMCIFSAASTQRNINLALQIIVSHLYSVYGFYGDCIPGGYR